MVNLLNIINENSIEKGVGKRISTKNGQQNMDTYFIPIKYLYYNDLNGRIATFIEEYNDQHKDCKLNKLKVEDINLYNELISGYVKQSSNDNMASYKKTKDNIFKKGQMVPGVVLSDGRIIDGNRRFTAIRELYKESGNPRFEFFETVVLPAPDLNDKDKWKEIKSLELNIQFNEDEKRDYDKIDFLVSFYRDVIDEETRLLDKTSYIYQSGMKLSEFEKNERIVDVMLDYLYWIGKPKAFYILKKEKLDGPLEEIQLLKAKLSEEEWDDKKDYIYAHMGLVTQGSRTTQIRKLIKSAKEDGTYFETFKEKVDDEIGLKNIVDTIHNKYEQDKTPDETLYKKQEMKNMSEHIDKIVAEAEFNDKIDRDKNKPIDSLNNVIKILKNISPKDVEFLDEIDKKKFYELYDEINELLKDLSNR